MPFHNLQQMSDVLDELQATKNKDGENAAAFLVSQVQPLVTRITTLETAVASLQTELAAIKGVK